MQYIMDEIVVRGKIAGYKFEPWLKTSKEDMMILNMKYMLYILREAGPPGILFTRLM